MGKNDDQILDLEREIEDRVYSKREKRVVVLGAFDTWPYMDTVSRILTTKNKIAITSRYIYRRSNNKLIRTQNSPDPDQFMVDFLESMIMKCPKAIIIHSVPAGHYIEVHWCYHKHIETLGIAFVRDIFSEKHSFPSCSNLIIDKQNRFSICMGSRTVWECMSDRETFCPFIQQGISKNVIEYYMRSKEMILVATENIENIDAVVTLWLNKKLV